MKIAKFLCTIGAPLALAACGSEKDPAEAPQAADGVASAPAAEAAVAPAAPEAPVDATLAAPAAEPVAAATTPAEPAAPAPAVASSGPPDSFLICSSCHAVEPGKNGIGPSIAGIYGKKAASVAGYSYSDALKKANITWTDAALDKWLEAPMKMVPGTTMVFGGIPDARKRKELIAYMKSL